MGFEPDVIGTNLLLAPLVGGAFLGTSLGALPEATELNLMCASAIAPSFPRCRRRFGAHAGHEALILLVLVSAPPGLMATFTASSIGSLNGTSIRSNPFS